MSMSPRTRISDAQSLRALAHPARVALIEALAVHGSLTATEAGELIGQSPSNCSFHLRQLARFGLIESAPSADARNRPWQVVEGGIGVDVNHLEDADFNAAAASLNELWIARQAAAETDWTRRSAHESTSWREAAFSDLTVRWLTAEELARLHERVDELLLEFRDRRDPAQRPAGTRPVRAYFSAFPAVVQRDRDGD
ncbi:MAG: ArsR/SmtB family transcription factor [Geodermatophilaceae bacterium]